MTKTLLAATAAFALVLGASGATWASHDIDDVGVFIDGEVIDDTGNVKVDDVIDGNVEKGGTAAVSIVALQQVSGNVAGAGGDFADDDFMDDEPMDFGNNTFQNQILNVNNFQNGINQAQQGAISIAVAFRSSDGD